MGWRAARPVGGTVDRIDIPQGYPGIGARRRGAMNEARLEGLHHGLKPSCGSEPREQLGDAEVFVSNSSAMAEGTLAVDGHLPVLIGAFRAS